MTHDEAKTIVNQHAARFRLKRDVLLDIVHSKLTEMENELYSIYQSLLRAAPAPEAPPKENP